MDYIEQYKIGCGVLASKIDAHLSATGGSPTYFCVKAGVHQAALVTVRRGTSKPETVEKLSRYLEKVTSS
jgi:hypothetical protein